MLKQVQMKLNTMFSDLMFDEQRHLYFVGNKRLPSVSSKVEGYTIPFDEAKMLPLSARKASYERGEEVTPEKLKAEWHMTRDQACELGHVTHSFLETYEGIQLPKFAQQKAGISFLKSLHGNYAIVKRELRGYSKKYSYAGTMDLPLMNLKTGKLVVADYKTNQKDLFKSYSNLKPPFQMLESHSYNKYQIQLGLYQIILEEAGFEVEERWLVHLRADGTFKTYNLYDFTGALRTDLASKQKIAA